MRILFTICGRAGSKGVKNKNLKSINGIPLVYYTLASIKLYMDAHPENQIDIVLNTDSRALSELMQNQKVITGIVEIERKAGLEGDSVAKVDVIKDSYLICKQSNSYDVVVDLDITSPMRRLEDIEGAINTLLSDEQTDLVFSVVPGRRNPYFNMVEEAGGYYKKVCSSGFTSRQQTPKVYELNASIYAYNPKFLDSKIDKTILDYKNRIVEMPDYLVLDIDSEEDFKLMTYLWDYFLKEDPGLDKLMNMVRKFDKQCCGE